jgi:hypothetical protein
MKAGSKPLLTSTSSGWKASSAGTTTRSKADLRGGRAGA